MKANYNLTKRRDPSTKTMKWYAAPASSQGVENMDDFDPQTMIKNVKFVFTPSATLKAALSQATFEQEGIVEDGIKYGSKLSYQKAKGLVTDDGSDDDGQQGSGGGQTQPGGSGEGGSGASGEE